MVTLNPRLEVTPQDAVRKAGDAGFAGSRCILAVRRPATAVALSLFAILMASQAFASGTLGPFPIDPRKFHDFAACKAYLEERYASDEKQHAIDVEAIRVASVVDARVMPERALETRGVVQTGDLEARYDVVHGYVSKLIDEDAKAIRSQYSYRERRFVCNDGMLTGIGMDGYHLESFEPIE